MVRMSDLVRGKGQAAPPPPASPASAPASGAASAPTAPPPASAPPAATVRPAAASGPRPAPRPEPAAAPSTPDVPEAAVREARAAVAEQLFSDLQQFLERTRDLIKTGTALPWTTLEQLLERVIDTLAVSPELFWVANRPSPPTGVDYLAFHQARVAVVATRVGANVGLDRLRLIELGLAAALIDVGLWQLPPTLLRRLEALSSDEQTQYRSHPRIGAELIRSWSPPFDAVVEMVLQHHEREQGQGFPRGLAGAAIRPEAKILGLADTYTGLTAPGSLKPGLRPHEAIRDIVRSKHEAFPPALIKALLSEISVFPPGTVVRLNTGEVGRVVAVNRNHPLRPRIEVIDDKGQRPATPKIIDLSEAPFLYITGPVTESAGGFR